MKRLRELIRQNTPSDPAMCIACGKCTSACPESGRYDRQIHQLMSLVSLGFDNDALSCKTIWLYAGGADREDLCPAGIKIPDVINQLRHQARIKGIKSGVASVACLSGIIQKDIRRMGRINPSGVALQYRFRTRSFFREFFFRLRLMKRSKISLYRSGVANYQEMEALFQEFSQAG